MMRYIIPMAMLFMLAGSAWGTMWLYDDPSFFQMGSSSQTGNFWPASISILDILDAPYFPLLGQGFYTDALPVQLSNSSNTVQISSSGVKNPSPTPITFDGHLENNLKYAQTKSSLRIGKEGTWTTLGTPGVL